MSGGSPSDYLDGLDSGWEAAFLGVEFHVAVREGDCDEALDILAKMEDFWRTPRRMIHNSRSAFAGGLR